MAPANTILSAVLLSSFAYHAACEGVTTSSPTSSPVVDSPLAVQAAPELPETKRWSHLIPSKPIPINPPPIGRPITVPSMSYTIRPPSIGRPINLLPTSIRKPSLTLAPVVVDAVTPVVEDWVAKPTMEEGWDAVSAAVPIRFMSTACFAVIASYAIALFL